MTFTYDWFETTGRANFEIHLNKFKGQPNLKFLEIGCFEGQATCWLLENILTAPSSKIHVIDTFEGSTEHKDFNMNLKDLLKTFEENVNPFPGKVIVWKGMSQDVLRKFESNTRFDFIYVDGSHQAPDVLEDAVLAFRLLSKDGIMIFDDYKWAKYDDRHMNPGMGIDAFISTFGNQLEVLLREYQVIIRKI